MKKCNSIAASICVFLFMISGITTATESGHGGFVIPISSIKEPENKNSSTEQVKFIRNIIINPDSDRVSIYLEKAILFKNREFFVKDKNAAITAKIEIHSKCKETGEETSINIDKVYKFDVSNNTKGNTLIPMSSLPIIEGYNLSGEITSSDKNCTPNVKPKHYEITGIVINLFLSSDKQKSGFSNTLEAIFTASKNLPIPSNPYGSEMVKVSNSFNQIIDIALKENTMTAPLASIGLSFIVPLTDNKSASKSIKIPQYFGIIFDESNRNIREYNNSINSLNTIKSTYPDYKETSNGDIIKSYPTYCGPLLNKDTRYFFYNDHHGLFTYNIIKKNNNEFNSLDEAYKNDKIVLILNNYLIFKIQASKKYPSNNINKSSSTPKTSKKKKNNTVSIINK